MKTISHWAKKHRLQAIVYLVLLQIIFFGFYFFAGISLFVFDVVFPKEVTYAGIILFAATGLIYPFKGVTKGWFKYSYRKAKSVQALVLLSSIILMCNLGNQLSRSSMITSTDMIYEVKPIVLDSKELNKKRTKFSKKQRRINRKTLKKKLRSFIKKARGKEKVTAGDIFLIIILGAVFTFGLGYLTLGLYCNLACSGQVGLANTVLVIGGALWVLGLIGIARWIIGNRQKAEEAKLKSGDGD